MVLQQHHQPLALAIVAAAGFRDTVLLLQHQQQLQLGWADGEFKSLGQAGLALPWLAPWHHSFGQGQNPLPAQGFAPRAKNLLVTPLFPLHLCPKEFCRKISRKREKMRQERKDIIWKGPASWWALEIWGCSASHWKECNFKFVHTSYETLRWPGF